MKVVPVIGQRVERYEVVESTNDLARAQAERGKAEGLVITAEEQAAGRGRMGRKWIVPRGTSLQLSVLLRPSLAPTAAARVVRMAALAVVETLADFLQLSPRLKWPNDVLLNGRKCAGILLESSLRGDELEYVVLGIGINVNYAMRDFPELAPFATTLQDAVGHAIDRSALERALLMQLDAQYRKLLYGKDFVQEYRARLDMLGQPIRVATRDGVLEGIAQNVADDGALVLARDGVLINLYAGDVTILKQATG